MLPLPSILADSDDVGKIIVGVIAFLIWGISALASMAKKQGKQSQASMEQAMREQIEEARRRQIAQLEQMQPTMPPPPMLQPQRPRGPAVPPMRNLPQAPRPVSRPNPMAQPPRLPQQRPVQQPQQRPKQGQKRKQRQPGQAPAVPVPPPMRAVPVAGDTPDVYISEIGHGSASASPSRRQAAATPMLRLTPQNLRQQFILTEILQPPLALRDRPQEH
jgi:hypothetical protein